jgi:purine-binding chemotaxis protein CheW
LRRQRILSPRLASMTKVSPDTLEPKNEVATAPAKEMRRVLVFTLAGRTRCVPVEDVREIVPIAPLTRLPGAPRYVRGLINLRGTLVTVIDASLCLYGVNADNNPDASILLVERKERVAGVMVDNVFDIQSLPAEEVDEVALLDLRAMVDQALA